MAYLLLRSANSASSKRVNWLVRSLSRNAKRSFTLTSSVWFAGSVSKTVNSANWMILPESSNM